MSDDFMVTQVSRHGAERYDGRDAKIFHVHGNPTPEQLEELKKKFMEAPIGSLSGARLPDVLTNSAFRLTIVPTYFAETTTSETEAALVKQYEMLSALMQKYVIEDGKLVITFTETEDFVVSRLLLERDADFKVNLTLYNRHVAERQYMRDWIFHQPRLIKIGGNAGQPGVQTLALQFTLKFMG